ncbi:MAG: hypothetical protein QOI26_155 [Pseudonocardiales bacterium]|nr:hypothetical protein [Pseudonocardiales bacterium]
MSLPAGPLITGQLAPTLLADSDTGKGSPIGLFVVLLLVVAVYFLYRSMSRHLRKVPEKFPGADDGSGSESATGSGAAASSDAGPGPGATTGSDVPPSPGQSVRPDSPRSDPEQPA